MAGPAIGDRGPAAYDRGWRRWPRGAVQLDPSLTIASRPVQARWSIHGRLPLTASRCQGGSRQLRRRAGRRSPGSAGEAVAAWKAVRRHAAGLAAPAEPGRQVGDRARALAARPAEAVREAERTGVGELAVPVALQQSRPCPGHHRQLVQRENQKLAVAADGRDVIALGRHRDHQALAVVQIEDLLAGPGLGGDRLLLGDEAAAGAGRQQELAVRADGRRA